MTDIIELLRLAKSREASDLHLVVDKPPMLRINGSLVPVEMLELTNESLESGLLNILTDDEIIPKIRSEGDIHTNLANLIEAFKQKSIEFIPGGGGKYGEISLSEI